MGLESRKCSNSTDSGAAKGKDWKYKLYFDPDANTSCGEKYDNITTNKLMSELKTLVGTNAKIKNVRMYKCSLTTCQPRIFDRVLYHMFVVFETDNGLWSIEKNSEGITIQRSKCKCSVIQPSHKLSAVVDRYR
ncbi:hypothetical protein DPMN_155306 [Dreissena polymorpha]|uniref:Uncharacterized protein n=1 Tax=Dreissena polymorpha TaxID=45954 RepID=A0A9D4JAS6_DREPO|nr:hypothetical protein DPMN_155306 [Dreissena polymorpha]